jgi:hypothetical protein
MIYLSGVPHQSVLNTGREDLGVILTPRMGNTLDLAGTVWAADTGCYSEPKSYNDDRYIAFLKARRRWSNRCLFATAPDVVGDASATWVRSWPMFPRIRAAGFKVALVAQDGIESGPVAWQAFDVLFIGGTTKWKLSHHAREMATEAKAHGMHVHMGRVNSLKRLQSAAMKGCDSADGTFLKVAPDENVPRLMNWLKKLDQAPVFNFGGG